MSDWPWDLTFEVAFDTNPGVEPTAWTDLSDRVREPVTIEHRQAGDTSTVRLTLNNRDRALDSSNPAAVLNLVPWRHARITVTYESVTYPLWRGFVEDWPPAWPEFNQGLINVRLVDPLAWLAGTDMDMDLPAQRSDERITALLDMAGWPADRRDITPGVVGVEAYEQSDANVLRVLLDAVDAEDGLLYVAPDGKITFRSRHHDFDAAPTLTFGPAGLKVREVTPRYGARDLVNIGRVELDDGDVYEIVDDASKLAYGPHPWTARDLPLRPAEAEALPQWVVVRFAQPPPDGLAGLEGLATNAHEAGLAQILTARLGDVADFAHTPPGGGTAAMTGTVESMVHTIGKGSWVTSCDLDRWYGQGPWLTLDDPVLGLLDGDNKLAP